MFGRRDFATTSHERFPSITCDDFESKTKLNPSTCCTLRDRSLLLLLLPLGPSCCLCTLLLLSSTMIPLLLSLTYQSLEGIAYRLPPFPCSCEMGLRVKRSRVTFSCRGSKIDELPLSGSSLSSHFSCASVEILKESYLGLKEEVEQIDVCVALYCCDPS